MTGRCVEGGYVEVEGVEGGCMEIGGVEGGGA